MTTRTVVTFFALTFAITWGISILLFLFMDQVVAVFGEIGLTNPLIILLIYAPGFVGVFLVWRHYGLKGLGSFFRRLAIWRAPWQWWLFLVLGIPAVVYLGAAIKSAATSAPITAPFTSVSELLPALALALFLGPIEEFGWRGVALPLLQRKFAPFWSGLILGVIWAAWHIPSFFSEGMPQSSWSIVPYLLGIVAICVILTPFFNSAGGSLLVAVLYHFQMMNPAWPDAQPYDNILWIVIAAVVVYLNRRTLFQRGGGVTQVLLPSN